MQVRVQAKGSMSAMPDCNCMIDYIQFDMQDEATNSFSLLAVGWGVEVMVCKVNAMNAKFYDLVCMSVCPSTCYMYMGC